MADSITLAIYESNKETQWHKSKKRRLNKNVQKVLEETRILNKSDKKGTVEYTELHKVIKKNKRKEQENKVNSTIKNNKNMKCIRPSIGSKPW